MKAWLSALVCVLGGVLAFAALGSLLLAFQRFTLRSIERALRPRVQERLAGAEVIKEAYGANFFGLKSRGMGQLRGNGALVLARDRLYFLQAVTKREMVIPLQEIVQVSVVRSHLHKWVGRPLLRVDFRSKGGKDAAAWFVRDAAGWKDALGSLTRKADDPPRVH